MTTKTENKVHFNPPLGSVGNAQELPEAHNDADMAPTNTDVKTDIEENSAAEVGNTPDAPDLTVKKKTKVEEVPLEEAVATTLKKGILSSKKAVSLVETREVTIYRAPTRSEYVKTNKKSIGERSAPLTATRGAVSKLVAASDLNRSLLPILIGVSPQDAGWAKAVNDYYSSFYVFIPEQGKSLNTSFQYNTLEDASDFSNKRDAIEEKYMAALKEAVTPESRKQAYGDYIDNIFNLEVEKNRYDRDLNGSKYGHPVNVGDYILWLFCLYSSIVANQVEYLNDSVHISFYLSDETEDEKRRTAMYNLKLRATGALLTILTDPVKIDVYLYAYMQRKPETSRFNIGTMALTDKGSLLDKLCSENYAEFLAIHEDKNLITKSHIEKLISFGVLERITNTSMIVNSEDPADIIGSNIQDAVAYFSADLNKPKVARFNARLQALSIR